MHGRFASLLRLTRQDSGFRSAYAFYRDNGARRLFPFTYAYYSRIEQGKALPRPSWLPILFSAMRRPPSSGTHRELILAYLRDVIDDDALFDDLVGPCIKPAEPVSAKAKTIRRLLGALTRPMGQEEFDSILSSRTAFWCFFCLTKSREPMSEADLTTKTGASAPQLRAALDELCRRKLAKRAPDGRYFSPLTDRYSSLPRAGPGHDQRMRTMGRYIDAAAARGGREFMARFALVRAEESDMLRVAHSLHEAVEAALGSAVEDAGERTGIFMVETRLRKIFRF